MAILPLLMDSDSDFGQDVLRNMPQTSSGVQYSKVKVWEDEGKKWKEPTTQQNSLQWNCASGAEQGPEGRALNRRGEGYG